jgi:hypothetical protein
MRLTSDRDSHGGRYQRIVDRSGTSLLGERGDSGTLVATFQRVSSARRVRGRRVGGNWLRDYPVPVVSVAVILVCLAVVAASAGVTRLLTAPAADTTANPNCTIIVPSDPLSAHGLATPYQLAATNPANGPCHEANADQTAFVQGAVLDPATGQITIYDPLVIDAGTQPAAPPVVPALPADAVIGLWFGYNGDTLTLAGADQEPSPSGASSTAAAVSGQAAAALSGQAAAANAGPRATVESAGSAPLSGSAGDQGWFNASLTNLGAGPTATGASTPAASTPASRLAASTPAIPAANPADRPAATATPDAILQQADCVGGEDINAAFSSFTQVAACDATAFFSAANAAISAGRLMVPAPGTAADDEDCWTTRSFALIDQDQSDNVTTEYLSTPGGEIAQDTAANRASLKGATTLVNGSDNGLLDLFVDPALGCAPWEAANLADAGAPVSALPLDELQAAAWAGRGGDGPAALVPLNDPMTLDAHGRFSTDKTNAYRALVDMPALPAGQSPAAYCSDMESIQGTRLQQDANLLLLGQSPQPGAANSLFTFLAMRLQQSFVNLSCGQFGLTNDVSTTVAGNGVVIAACFASQVGAITPGPGNPAAGKKACPAS